MKKFLFVLLMLLVIPNSVYGLNIKNVSITGDESVYTMTTIPLKVKIEFDSFDDLGIAALSYELKFNEYAFNIYNITTLDVWDSKVYKYDGNYYVVSSINPGASNRCSDGLLYCGSYEANLILYARDTDTIYSDDVSIGKIEVGLVNVNYGGKEITDKDITIVEGNGNTKKTININKKGAVRVIVPKIDITSSKPKINTQTKAFTSKKTTFIKSSNNYIESLLVEGYNLKFRQFTNDYNLTVKKDVNNLKLDVKLLSDKAKYTIVGNDDLMANNNEVKIEVTAENGSKNTYTIKIDHEKEVVIDKKEEKQEEKWYENKYIKYGGIALGGIILIMFFVNIILRIKDFKMEKQLKKL